MVSTLASTLDVTGLAGIIFLQFSYFYVRFYLFYVLDTHSESQDLKQDTSKDGRKGSGTLPSELVSLYNLSAAYRIEFYRSFEHDTVHK